MILIIDQDKTIRSACFRRGGMSYALLFSLIFFVVLTAFLFEIGRISIRKSQMQILADARAQSAAVLMARVLNEVTAMNHQIGEAMSFVVLHRAMYGETGTAEDLTDDERSEDAELTAELRRLDEALRALSMGSIEAEYLQPLRAGGAVGAAMLCAKRKVREIRQSQIAAKPDVGEATGSLSAEEELGKLSLEWQQLRAMELRKGDSLRHRRIVETSLIPGIEANQDRIVREYPKLDAELGLRLGHDDESGRRSYARPRALPVEREPWNPEKWAGKDSSMEKTQIVRSTYPWVVFDRVEVLERTEWMVKTRFPELFRERTDKETPKACRDHYEGGGKFMYVLVGRRPGCDKGEEPWRNDSTECDALFGTVAFEYWPARAPIGAPVLRTEHKAGQLTMTQALTYAGSRKMQRRHPPGSQLPTAWDTLQWRFEGDTFVPEFPVDPKRKIERPAIRLDWQARLVPLNSSLDHELNDVPAPIAAILRKILPLHRSIRTL